MNRFNKKQYGWRLVLSAILLAVLIYKVYRDYCITGEDMLTSTIIKALLDIGIYCGIVHGLFTHRFVPRSISYFLEFFRGKDSLLLAVMKFAGIQLAVVFGISGMVYFVDRSSEVAPPYFEILSYSVLIGLFLSVVIIAATYIKCCIVKRNDNNE